MKLQTFTESELHSKKYGELLKLAKSLHLRSSSATGRKLKTSKVIEMILEAQAAKSISKEAASMVNALDASLTKESEAKPLEEEVPVSNHSDELLSDIQFPDDLDYEGPVEMESLPETKGNDEADGKEKHSRSGTFEIDETPAEYLKRRRTSTFEVLPGTESNEDGDSKIVTGGKPKRRKTSTFEVSPSRESNGGGNSETLTGGNPKRRKTSTFEVSPSTESKGDCDNSETLTKGNPKRRKTSTFEVSLSTESKEDCDNSETLTECKPERRRTSTFEKKTAVGASDPPDNTNTDQLQENSKQLEALTKRISDSKQETPGTTELPSVSLQESKKTPQTPQRAGTFIRKARRSVVTPAPAQMTPIILRTAERASIKSAKRASLVASIASSAKVATGSPKSVNKATPAKIAKPMFNVGRGDTPKEGSKASSSGIPRFVTYAQKLKVPNFAKIHEKAFKKMEALDDYEEKKRKKLENTGPKKPRPMPQSEVFKPEITSVKNIKLNFGATNSPAKRLKSLGKPEPVARKSLQTTGPQKNVTEKKTPRSIVKPAFGKLKSPKVLAKKTPGTNISHIKKPSLPVRSARKSPSVAKVSHRALPIPRQENVNPGHASLPSPALHKMTHADGGAASPGTLMKRLGYNPKASVKKPLGYVPYKGALKPINKADVRKAMSEKLPTIKTMKERREDQKKILKGVRSNKRFELQNAKRGII